VGKTYRLEVHMTDTTQTVQKIVDSNCVKLLNEIKHAHPNSDVGVSVALYYPGNTDVPSFFKYGLAAKCVGQIRLAIAKGQLTIEIAPHQHCAFANRGFV